MNNPKLFIGSSVEALPIARAINDELQFDFDIKLWNTGIFRIGYSSLEDLIKELNTTDFASFVFFPEDNLCKKNETKLSVRDNVIFEYGLFLGRLGRDRTSFCKLRNSNMHLPTDLAGINGGEFEYPCANIQQSVSSYCNEVRKQKMLGLINPLSDGVAGDNTERFDFYKSNFGERREAILKKEKIAPASSTANYDKFSVNRYIEKYYFYQSGIFYKGETQESYQLAKEFPQLILCCLGDYRNRITDLKSKFGTPISHDIDIYSFNNTDGDYLRHDDFMIGQEIMNGVKEFCYQFKDEHKIVTCTLSKLKNKEKKSPYSYTITTTYEKCN